MVKGISRQVIVVHSPDPKLFEQAIFILKDEALGQGVTDEDLLKEAQQVIQSTGTGTNGAKSYGPVWACFGAAAMGLVWLATMVL